MPRDRLITNEELADAKLDFGWDQVHVEWGEGDTVQHIRHIPTGIDLDLDETWHMDDNDIRHEALVKLNEVVKKAKD